MTTSALWIWGLMFSNLLVFTGEAFAQNSMPELRTNRAVLRYFNGNDLDDLKIQAPDKYQVVSDYFTNSFIVELNNEELGEINYNKFYNSDLFNIVDFDYLRDPLANTSFIFKENYIITLRSKEWLKNELNGFTVEEVLKLRVPRPLPSWTSSGNATEDYLVYKRSLEAWIRDFTEEYRQITSENLVPKIRISEWNEFPQDKKQQFMNLPNGYLIVD